MKRNGAPFLWNGCAVLAEYANYVLPIEIPFIMAANFFSVGMMNAVWTYKHTMGLFHYGRFLQFATGVLNIIFSIFFGKIWGLFGILGATLCARLATSLWYDPYAVFKYGFNKSPLLYVRKYLQYLVVMIIAAIGCKLSFRVLIGSLAIKVIEEIILCSVVTNVCFWVALHRQPEFIKLKEILSRILSIVRIKKS